MVGKFAQNFNLLNFLNDHNAWQAVIQKIKLRFLCHDIITYVYVHIHIMPNYKWKLPVKQKFICEAHFVDLSRHMGNKTAMASNNLYEFNTRIMGISRYHVRVIVFRVYASDHRSYHFACLTTLYSYLYSH